eukprot:6181060-Pleurochrysis_carterae.AAC.4
MIVKESGGEVSVRAACCVPVCSTVTRSGFQAARALLRGKLTSPSLLACCSELRLHRLEARMSETSVLGCRRFHVGLSAAGACYLVVRWQAGFSTPTRVFFTSSFFFFLCALL